MCKFSQRGYANFLYNQRISEIASSCILEGRVNQTNLSNINNILTPPSTPVNREEDQPEQDFIEAVENEFIQENLAFVRALKQQKQYRNTSIYIDSYCAVF